MTRKCNFRFCRNNSDGECLNLFERNRCLDMMRDLLPVQDDRRELLVEIAETVADQTEQKRSGTPGVGESGPI